MKNSKYYAETGRGLEMACPVPEGTKAGIPVMVGEMLVIPQHDRVTQDTRNAGTAPQGVPLGWASCFLPGLGQVCDLEVPAEATVGAKVYLEGGKAALSGSLHIGFVVQAPGYNGGKFVAVRGN